MALVPKFTKSDIRKAIKQKKIAFQNAVLNRLELIGWTFVRMAREKTRDQGGFGDVTGNLRSSIGFAIVDHGRIKVQNYETVKKGKDGKKEAKAFIQTLKDDFDQGYALIVVAGMGYAAAVESKGKDVITGSSLEAEKLLKRAIKELQRKA